MILAVVLLMAGTILTTTAATTMVPAAYAGGDNDDGNKQKAEDDSSAGTADCDDNEVEQAGFDCIAIAANNIEIEPPGETTTLSVCKEVRSGDFSPDQFDFTVTRNGLILAQFEGVDDPPRNCVDVTISPGEYTVSEVGPVPDIIASIEGDCVEDPNAVNRAIGDIQAGEAQECRFINDLQD
jgi:hypothetical protein